LDQVIDQVRIVGKRRVCYRHIAILFPHRQGAVAYVPGAVKDSRRRYSKVCRLDACRGWRTKVEACLRLRASTRGG
jgi:hypothetical protein